MENTALAGQIPVEPPPFPAVTPAGRIRRGGVLCAPMIVGIPKEIYPHERRVAATPDVVQKLKKLGYDVMVEAGAGEASDITDADYTEAGAVVAAAAPALWAAADIVLKVRQPVARPGGEHEADR